MGRKNFIPLAISIMVMQSLITAFFLNPLSRMPIIGMPLVIALNILCAILVFHIYVRRLHDLGLSGWVLLLTFIPFVGWMFAIVLLILLMVIPGNKGRNCYGESEQERSIYNAFFSL